LNAELQAVIVSNYLQQKQNNDDLDREYTIHERNISPFGSFRKKQPRVNFLAEPFAEAPGLAISAKS